MPRTTLNLDASVLRELKRRAAESGKSLGDLVSEYLARAMAGEDRTPSPRPLAWTSQPMDARVDLKDRDAMQALLDDQLDGQ